MYECIIVCLCGSGIFKARQGFSSHLIKMAFVDDDNNRLVTRESKISQRFARIMQLLADNGRQTGPIADQIRAHFCRTSKDAMVNMSHSAVYRTQNWDKWFELLCQPTKSGSTVHQRIIKELCLTQAGCLWIQRYLPLFGVQVLVHGRAPVRSIKPVISH